MTTFPDLHKGVKAYIDCFSGCVPCVVTKVDGKSHVPISSLKVEVRITTDFKAYRKGEVLNISSLHIIPRKARYLKGYHYRIGHYTVGMAG